MRAWLVRCGSDGEREVPALNQNRSLIGWPEVPDMSRCLDREAVRRLIVESYGDDLSRAVLGNWTGQLWRFLSEISDGDLIVMPLRSDPGSVALGRVEGAYFYHSENKDPGMRHSRRVKWKSPISKDSFRPDLLASFGSLLTVCELSRNRAAERISSVYEGGTDLGAEGEPLGQFEDLVERAPIELEIRNLLEMRGYFRRSASIIEEVTNELAALGLLAIPSIADGSINSSVRIVPAPGGSDAVERTLEPEVEQATATAGAVIGGEIRYGIGTLPSADCEVASVNQDDTIRAAVMKMAVHHYSQLAVTDDDGRLVASLTWESIAMALLSGRPSKVHEVMEPAPSVQPEDELLVHADTIFTFGYVFVRNRNGSVLGIVTSSDLTKRFGDDHRPIVYLEEIERRLAHRVQLNCTAEDMAAAGVRVYGAGPTMGTFVKILEVPELWETLGWEGLEQAAFVAMVERVRNIRNQLMHFSPDPIGADDVEFLRRSLRLLRLVTRGTGFEAR